MVDGVDFTGIQIDGNDVTRAMSNFMVGNKIDFL
jgi:endonuclease V-like protein UPF0215 family